ncbi:hypothetical protein FNO01nite_29870 [Flavobacterium noncentrifugens]|uniref:WxcM-like, C-terminal n=1 Tax=Flavobacterium noncentrifugens TaxID=1128970 RepID=A0A1G9BNK3_9FLAO|nr:FdtA/QdtA family cupin domain-containing protein [Flavobacterium noncentrifugens]GEP52315.1 hypothetical protein FNO01nite_29870 [Flavobacterium noncentrifugens]SDK41058.1 WxcM-like, C-terminal [Flavobacterium noncentrifugens]
MKQSLQDIELIQIPKIHNRQGNLSVIEGNTIPFEIRRVYYLYDVPSNAERYGHAHKAQQKFLVALSGSFEVVLKDGTDEMVFLLNKPNFGLLIAPGNWREIRNFSSGAVCLVLASEVYDESDYIRDFDEFTSFKDRIS